MREHRSLATLRGDVVGGTIATILALPEGIAFGALAFAPLGPEFLPFGAVAGLIALCFANLGAAPSGSVGIMHNGPLSLASLTLASAFVVILQNIGPAGSVSTAIALLFLVVLMAGVLQVLFGVLELGDLAKYIPYPVTAGLMNGTAGRYP